MDKILQYILIGVGLFLLALIIATIFMIYWKSSYDTRKREREQKKLEKLKWQYAKVSKNNFILEKITQTRFIIFKGSWGKGKSILMNLVAHYLWEKELNNINSQLRYNRIMRADYLSEYEALTQENLLPVYSNLDFIQDNTLKSQELEPFITLKRKAIQKAIFCIDEFSSLFPKEMHYESYNDPKIVEMKEFFKKNRHYTNGWILGTEQDGEDIYKGFRKNGYEIVTALGTVASLPPKAKTLRKIKNFFNIVFPAFCTVNSKQLMMQELFKKDKFTLLFKLLFPSYFFLPRCYYAKKQSINNKIKEKYMRFQTLLECDNQEFYLRYTNDDIFQYNTRAYKHEYDSKFDEKGNRKAEK